MVCRRTSALSLALLFVAAGIVQATDRDLFEEGNRRFTAGNYTLAIERYERLLDDYPASRYRGDAQLRIAQSAFYLGDYADALERLRRIAVRARAGDLAPTVQLWIGLTSYQLDNMTDADTALSRHIDTAPTPQGRAWLYRGLARVRLGRIDAAREDLTTALRQTEAREQAYAAAVLMELAYDADDFATVLQVYESLPVVAPSEPYAEQRLRYAADAARESGRVEEAIRRYRLLADYSIASAQWAYRQLYAIFRDRQDRATMAEVYRDAEQRLAAEPQRLAEFWFALGTDALERERYELAELYLSRLWDVRSQRTIDGTAALYLARAMEAQDRPGEAIGLLTESLVDAAVTDAVRPERVASAARLLVQQGAFARAAGLLEEYAVVTHTAGTLYTWAYARYREGVVDGPLERLRAGETQPLVREFPPLMRLRGRLLLEAGEPAEAVRSYRQYLTERPEDGVARTELIRGLVAAEQYGAADQEIARFREDPAYAELSEDRRGELRYLGAVAAFNRQNYRAAAAGFEAVTDPTFEPVRSYYLAWSLYRTGSTAAARRTIVPVVDRLPDELIADGRYLLAWTLYRAGETERAADQLLQILGLPVDSADTRRARQLLATVYLEEARFDAALAQYEALAGDATDRRREAQYRQLAASTLVAAGRSDAAIAAYDAIADRYRETAVGQRALLEAGELLIDAGSDRLARERFREYNSRYPDGPDIDAALYWAGHTSYRLDEAGRALLWWEPLINEYPRSSYTPDALFLTAEIYAGRGQRRQALELYDRLAAAYPEHNRAREAERRRRTIRLELDGLSSREADLWVRLEPGGGAGPEPGSGEWFDLVLALGRIAIREQITLTRERARIVDKLIDATRFDGTPAAEASILLAEYYRRRGETNAALDQYVDAAATDGASDEIRAQSLYELAVLARESGEQSVAEQARAELRERYGETIWADRAESLRETN